jgi:hypothetical protein
MSRGYNNGSNNGIAFKHNSPASMGYQDDLYAVLNVGEELKQWLEVNFFQMVDDEASVAMRELTAGNTNLDIKQREAWTRFIMSLMSRTPDKIDWVRGSYDREVPNLKAQLVDAYNEATAGQDPQPTDEEREAAIAHAFGLGTARLIQSIMDLPNVGTEIIKMRWVVITIADGGRDFLTSDKPVYLSKGLQHSDAFFALPISPRHLFVASKEQWVLEELSAKSKADLTQATNKTVVEQAIKYVYSTSTLERNFIAKYLRR